MRPATGRTVAPEPRRIYSTAQPNTRPFDPKRLSFNTYYRPWHVARQHHFATARQQEHLTNTHRTIELARFAKLGEVS